MRLNSVTLKSTDAKGCTDSRRSFANSYRGGRVQGPGTFCVREESDEDRIFEIFQNSFVIHTRLNRLTFSRLHPAIEL